MFFFTLECCRCHRTDWRWSKDRTQIASRWTWLQAQVSDLEYRIRQQNEIYKQIRQAKGEISLAESAPSSDNSQSASQDIEKKLLLLKERNELSAANVSSLLSSNLDQQQSSLSSDSQSTSRVPSTLNGLVGTCSQSAAPNAPSASLNSSCSSSTSKAESCSGVESNDAVCKAARCRPLELTSYRKRKLLRTSGLHLHSKKAARLSNVKCQCYPPATPCILCGGRYNNMMGCDNELTPVCERIALLDHSYHQVLSFDEGWFLCRVSRYNTSVIDHLIGVSIFCMLHVTNYVEDK